ncbi:hypothetical protein [Nocardia vulneris]|uniref:Ig-like domain-containing protein n=1 Tax=Nocardia vulneris TaxID=1141657 RepID=A0ABR4ZEZ7_9NOCA|nr:hypothetical protein [Nocardia vulneris]KIA63662.1 hypothetical protein FG87_17730 [Nocardia vulneris]
MRVFKQLSMIAAAVVVAGAVGGAVGSADVTAAPVASTYHVKMTITGPNVVGQVTTVTITGDCVGYPPSQRIGLLINGDYWASFTNPTCDPGDSHWGQVGWTPTNPGDHTLTAYMTIYDEKVESVSETVTIGPAVP